MNGMNRYRVLWVDEEVDSGFVELAESYGLEVVQYTSWERGRAAFVSQASAWDAVILDGNCVIEEGGAVSGDFLYQAASELKAAMAQKGVSVPWYVMSSGSAEDFAKTLSRIELGERKQQTDRWGRMAYGKSEGEREQLLLAICRAVAHSHENKIRFMYGEVFESLDLYFDRRAAQVMLTILEALHYPEENRKFDPVAYYTQLRRILEYLFRAANKLGLLPDELLHGDKVNLTNSSCYLDGQIVKGDNHTTMKLAGYDARVFPPIIAGIVKKIINVANKETHTTDITQEEEEILSGYYSEVGSHYMLFGYALQVCDVVTWFGNYAKAHPDPLANRRMHSIRTWEHEREGERQQPAGSKGHEQGQRRNGKPYGNRQRGSNAKPSERTANGPKANRKPRRPKSQRNWEKDEM